MIEVINYSDVIEIKHGANELFLNKSSPIRDIINDIIEMKKAIRLNKEYRTYTFEDIELQRLSDGEFLCCFDERYTVVIGDWLNEYVLWDLIHEIITDDFYGNYIIYGDNVTRVDNV